MRVVLDECLPKRLCRELGSHEASTVALLGLAGTKNGKLLRALAGRCEAFITVDGNLAYQQSLRGLSFAVIILQAPSNKIEDLRPLAPAILAALESMEAGTVARIAR